MCLNSVLPTLFHYTSPTPSDKNKRSWARLIILRETDIIKLFQMISSYQFSWILLMCPRYLPWHIYVPISLPLWIYLSHSVHLFLTDDVTADLPTQCQLPWLPWKVLKAISLLPRRTSIKCYILKRFRSLCASFLCLTCHGREISIVGEDVLYSQFLQSVLQIDLLLHLKPEQVRFDLELSLGFKKGTI